jgi:hypothetical protein
MAVTSVDNYSRPCEVERIHLSLEYIFFLHSRNMGVIYLNVYVTICPLASASCLHGYLDPPNRSVTILYEHTQNKTYMHYG